ncbi:MAG TPA: hypothetical protein VGR81_04640 [Candidatus Acidoferrales bacterium]|nr:hypothetical protein [Candidatus Acidoferrales bacterium]
MMAGMPVKMLKKKLQMPRIMLARALPLVGALARGGGKTFAADVEATAEASAPQTLQKRLESSRLDPHFGQSFMAASRISQSQTPF